MNCTKCGGVVEEGDLSILVCKTCGLVREDSVISDDLEMAGTDHYTKYFQLPHLSKSMLAGKQQLEILLSQVRAPTGIRRQSIRAYIELLKRITKPGKKFRYKLVGGCCLLYIARIHNFSVRVKRIAQMLDVSAAEFFAVWKRMEGQLKIAHPPMATDIPPCVIFAHVRRVTTELVKPMMASARTVENTARDLLALLRTDSVESGLNPANFATAVALLACNLLQSETTQQLPVLSTKAALSKLQHDPSLQCNYSVVCQCILHIKRALVQFAGAVCIQNVTIENVLSHARFLINNRSHIIDVMQYRRSKLLEQSLSFPPPSLDVSTEDTAQSRKRVCTNSWRIRQLQQAEQFIRNSEVAINSTRSDRIVCVTANSKCNDAAAEADCNGATAKADNANAQSISNDANLASKSSDVTPDLLQESTCDASHSNDVPVSVCSSATPHHFNHGHGAFSGADSMNHTSIDNASNKPLLDGCTSSEHTVATRRTVDENRVVQCMVHLLQLGWDREKVLNSDIELLLQHSVKTPAWSNLDAADESADVLTSAIPDELMGAYIKSEREIELETRSLSSLAGSCANV